MMTKRNREFEMEVLRLAFCLIISELSTLQTSLLRTTENILVVSCSALNEASASETEGPAEDDAEGLDADLERALQLSRETFEAPVVRHVFGH